MCREHCIWPDWHSLPKGPAGLPIVHGLPMDLAEYQGTGWHSRGTYVSGLGVTEHQWIAPLSGHIAWSRRQRDERERRIGEAQARRAADDEWSDNVVSMIEEKRR
jgi:hypothetical protein